MLYYYPRGLVSLYDDGSESYESWVEEEGEGDCLVVCFMYVAFESGFDISILWQRSTIYMWT
jgi:hypothetical protein